MPFVKRDENGDITAVADRAHGDCTERIEASDPALGEFINSLGGDSQGLEATDQDFIRVLEDVVDLLIAKGVILFTELPDSAQAKILNRQDLRSRLGAALDLIGDD